MKKFNTLTLPLLSSIFFLFAWETYVHFGFIDKTLLPSPSLIWQAGINNWQIILVHSTQTIIESLIGLGVAIVLGLITAVALFLSPISRRALYPFLVLSQTIPLIALAPLLLLWFGFDLLPKVIIVTLYCFFPIAIAVSDGLMQTNQVYIDLLKSMRANTWQVLTIVHFPSVLPAFFSGLKIAVTYAVTAAIVGEFVGAYQGLGVFMKTSANSHAVTLVFAAIAITSLLSIFFLGIVFLIEKFCIPWNKKYV